MTWVRRAEDYAFFWNDGRPLAFAHRGGALSGDNTGIENSLAAFAAAVEMGFRYVETDVHATADGVLLAFHDASLDRVTDKRGKVVDLSYDEIRPARIGGREPIPLLSDLLTTWPELKVNVDCKSRRAIAPLARIVAEHDAWDRVCLASFSPWRLRQLRAAVGPRVATSYTGAGVAGLRFLPAYRLRAVAIGRPGLAAQVPVAIGPLQVVTRDFVDRAHELGKHVHVWTVDQRAEMNRLLDLGVDGLITDRTDVLRDVYTSRGLWPT